MRKNFIIDTNVFLHDVNALTAFADNTVIIPISVIEELDSFKNTANELGKNARVISRRLDELRKKGKLNLGVKLESGGIIRIDLDHAQVLPKEFKLGEADNRILNTAFWYQKKNEKTIVVSKDTNLRLKAEAVGIDAQDYEAGKVDINELYSGIRELETPAAQIDKFYKDKSLELKGQYCPNEFVVLKSAESAKKSALGRVVEAGASSSVIKPLAAQEPVPWGIKALNKEQRFAIELLLDDSLSLVTLLGVAGTGKTLISLAAGLQKAVDDNVYRRLIICRSVVPVGRDIGYLPGTKEEKLNVWMGAIYDNLEFLADKKHPDEGMHHFEYLLQSGKVEIASVTHIRGRTLPKQYMIVDDAQNLSPHEVKTILSRAGEGTKVVVTGDPYQIDTPYLDVASNGLTYIVDRFKGQKMYGHITFTKTERSPLAALVAELL
ncbi:MAG: PhoH family protein [Elusimicrobia bacterium]|nr:PhoH family protein [Elusimicrobiota bacterium]